MLSGKGPSKFCVGPHSYVQATPWSKRCLTSSVASQQPTPLRPVVEIEVGEVAVVEEGVEDAADGELATEVADAAEEDAAEEDAAEEDAAAAVSTLRNEVDAVPEDEAEVSDKNPRADEFEEGKLEVAGEDKAA